MILRKNKAYIKRSPIDRRSSEDRRIIDMGPKAGGKERRIHKDRRNCFEERFGWKRVTKWTSVPSDKNLP